MSEKEIVEEQLAAKLIQGLKKDPTVDEFLLFTHVLAQYLALGHRNIVSKMLDYAHNVRRNNANNPESRIHVLADLVAGMLESYFATLESVQRVERLVVEVSSQTLWLQIVKTLDSGGEWCQADIIALVKELSSGADPAQTLAIALDDLEARELVECWHRDVDPVKRVYSLSNLGNEVRAKIVSK